jgi:hypothetical protein
VGTSERHLRVNTLEYSSHMGCVFTKEDPDMPIQAFSPLPGLPALPRQRVLSDTWTSLTNKCNPFDMGMATWDLDSTIDALTEADLFHDLVGPSSSIGPAGPPPSPRRGVERPKHAGCVFNALAQEVADPAGAFQN